MNIKSNKKSCFYKLISGIILVLCMITLTIALSGCSSDNDYSLKLSDSKVKSSSLIDSSVLKVGVDADNPPLAGQSSKIIGIDVDIAAAIADELGLKLEVVDVGSSPQDAVNGKKVDIVLGLEQSSTSTPGLWKSEPYLETAAALFSTNSNAPVPKKADKYKFATQMASTSASLCQNQFDSTNIKVVSDLSSAFNDLKNGTVDYVAADAVIGSYTAFSSEINANVVAVMQNISGYCVGIPTTNIDLQLQIKSALSNIMTKGVASVIECKWLGKNLNLRNVPKTEGANNAVNMSELDSAVYGHETGSAQHS